jgi:undecaprenyl pyrophosphate phosphatase UppP
MQIENANKAPALSFAFLLIACVIASAISAVRIQQGSNPNPLGIFAIFNACLPYAFVASIAIGLYAVSWATENVVAKNAAAAAMVVLGVGCFVFSVFAH